MPRIEDYALLGDPAAHRQLGDTPQAFGHFALVISALQLHIGHMVRSDNPMMT